MIEPHKDSVDVDFLSVNDIELAATVAVQRRISAMRNRHGSTYGMGRSNLFQSDIDGCIAELAIAKYTGQEWDCGNMPKQGDVGTDEVRSTNYLNGKLIVHPKDNDDAVFWLVTGQHGDEFGGLKIRGWLYGRECKREHWWSDFKNNGRFAYCVPQTHLNKAAERACSNA